jgi:hypothetical protein
VTDLPEPNWGDDQVLSDPWSIIVDALLYQRADTPLPDELQEAVEHAGMTLTALALLRVDGWDIEDVDDLWDRDQLEWVFGWEEGDESLYVEAKWGDGEEPGHVRTTVRGLGGRLNAKFVDDG